jgi:hypothetical protein
MAREGTFGVLTYRIDNVHHVMTLQVWEDKHNVLTVD